jgi:hypothetical protein
MLSAKNNSPKTVADKMEQERDHRAFDRLSANNIRRFIVAQYEDNPLIKYNQDKWVVINNYQHTDSSFLIQLWYLLNKQIIGILQNTTAETLSAPAVQEISIPLNGWLKITSNT